MPFNSVSLKVSTSREGALSSAFSVCLCRTYIPYIHKLLKFGKWRFIYMYVYIKACINSQYLSSGLIQTCLLLVLVPYTCHLRIPKKTPTPRLRSAKTIRTKVCTGSTKTCEIARQEIQSTPRPYPIGIHGTETGIYLPTIIYQNVGQYLGVSKKLGIPQNGW